MNVEELNQECIKAKTRDFTELLDSISSLSDKKKQLWREIYENAIVDRNNAYMMYAKLVNIVEDKSSEHAVHGKNIATYIERMSKANDQLLKLAELVADAENDAEKINPDDIFSQIKN